MFPSNCSFLAKGKHELMAGLLLSGLCLLCFLISRLSVCGNGSSLFLCSLCSRRRGMPSSESAVGYLLDVAMEVKRYLAKMLT